MSNNYLTDGGQLEYDSVEEGMKQVLSKYGVEEDHAENLVTLTFGTPALTRDIPEGKEEVMEIYKESLGNTEYEQDLAEDVDPEQVQTELDEVVREGLDGEIRGPASVSDEILE